MRFVYIFLLCVPKQHILNLTKNKLDKERSKLLAIEKSGALRDPVTKLNENRRELLYLSERITNLTVSAVDGNKMKYAALAGKLNALSPLGVISRGYALAERHGKVVTKVKDISVNDEISVRLSDGTLKAKVIGIEED